MDSLHTPGVWTLVTFTADELVVGELAALKSRFGAVRCVAVVPAPTAAPPGVPVLVDQDGALAAELAVRDTQSWLLDGRGAVAHRWKGLPDAEALAVFAGRTPLPSTPPAWLFPALAAVVLVAAIGAWAWTRAPQAPVVVTPPEVAAAPAPTAPTEAAPAAAPADEPEADEAAADDEAPAAGGPAAGGPKVRKARQPPNVFGEWTVSPRPQAKEVASLAGGTLTLKALAEKPVSGCTAGKPLSGPVTVSGEWKLDGITGKNAKLMVRQRDGANKPIKDPSARSPLARGDGTAPWKAFSATITPAAGAASYTLCAELPPGGGSLSVRGVK